MLFDLPAELTEHIVKQLNSQSELLRLGSACRQARAACKPHIFFYLRIQVGRESQNDRNMSILKSLSRGETDVAKFVHNLSIITNFPHRYTDAYNKTARTKARALEKMMKLIISVIPQFVSLNYFHCDLECSGGYKSPDVDIIVRALAKLPHLTSLSLDFGHGPFLLVPPYLTRSSLSQFKNLHSVEICGEASSYETVLGPLLANNPELTRLTIFGGQSALVASLGEFQARYGIHDIPITSIFIRCSLDATIPQFLPHLRHLRIADIHDAVIPADFWMALVHKGITLVTLLTDTTTDALMAYLESYSGLEVLSLSPANDHHAEAFYRRVLLHHSYSLRKLSIEIKSVGKWCVGPRVLEVLSRCMKIVELNMPIYIVYQPSVVYDPRQGAMYLQHILTLLPNLRKLFLRGPKPTEEYTSLCLQSAISHFRSDRLLDLEVSTDLWVYRAKREDGVYVLRCVGTWKVTRLPWRLCLPIKPSSFGSPVISEKLPGDVQPRILARRRRYRLFLLAHSGWCRRKESIYLDKNALCQVDGRETRDNGGSKANKVTIKSARLPTATPLSSTVPDPPLEQALVDSAIDIRALAFVSSRRPRTGRIF